MTDHNRPLYSLTVGEYIELTTNLQKQALAEIKPVAQQEPSDQWFDLVELCNYLPDKPAKATVYTWVHQRLIPCHKKSKKLFFLKGQIDNWLKTGRKKTAVEILNDVK